MHVVNERKQLLINKWRWILEEWDYTISVEENMAHLLEAYPDLRKYKAYDPLCQEYVVIDHPCIGCPLMGDQAGDCVNCRKTWSELVEAKNPVATNYARKILYAVMKSQNIF